MDGIGYATIADQFAKGLFREGLNNVFSPMYPLFVSLLHLAVPDVELAGRVVSLFFGVLLIWISFLFANRLLGDSRKALWMAALVAFPPYLLRFSSQVLSESVATFLFTLSVFSFFLGWQERRRSALALSGLCLVMTYLTRPEYLVFYAPFALLLLGRKRLVDCVMLLAPFLIVGLLYISYLHMQTGTYTVSNRVALSPFAGLAAFFPTIPFVSYDFMVAIFPLFFLLAICGLRRTNGPYRGLVLFLVVFHVLSLSFISHSTKRYSVEFVPILTIFAVEGIYAVREYFERLVPQRIVSSILLAAVIFMGILEPLTFSSNDRGLQKQAGLFLLKRGSGSVIAARLPLAAFYSKGQPVNLSSEMEADPSAEHFNRVLADRKVDYLVIDNELEKEVPMLKNRLSGWVPLYSLDHKGAFVKVYKVS